MKNFFSPLARQYSYICLRVTPPWRLFLEFFLLAATIDIVVWMGNNAPDALHTLFYGFGVSAVVATVITFLFACVSYLTGVRLVSRIHEDVKMEWTPNLRHLLLRSNEGFLWLPHNIVTIFTEYQTDLPEWFIQRLQDQIYNREAEAHKLQTTDDTLE